MGIKNEEIQRLLFIKIQICIVYLNSLHNTCKSYHDYEGGIRQAVPKCSVWAR